MSLPTISRTRTPQLVAPHSEKSARASRMILRATAGREQLERDRRALEAGLELARCTECGRVLFLYAPPLGRVRAVCKRCGRWNEFRAEGPAVT